MIAGLDDWTDEELVRTVLEGPRRAYVWVPGLEVIERPGWLQLVAPQFRQGGLNGVALAVLADDEADAVIDATIARYADLGLKFRWTVAPDSRPLDLAARLTTRGLHGELGAAMARATAGADDLGSTLADDITVERCDHATVATFDRVLGEGWNMDPTPFAAYHRAVLDAPAGTAALYVARWRGEPAAAAGCMRVGRALYLMGGVVLPAFRGRGLYRALVIARLRDAAAAGVPLAVTHARVATSAPILARLGFATVCDVTSFTNR